MAQRVETRSADTIEARPPTGRNTAVARRVETRRSHHTLPPWILSMTTILLACAALGILVWQPRTVWLALVVGVLSVVSWVTFNRLRAATKQGSGSIAVANTGLLLGVLVVVPLLAFAVLWTGLLLIIGVTWLLHAIGLA